jgi:hypothetical protein
VTSADVIPVKNRASEEMCSLRSSIQRDSTNTRQAHRPSDDADGSVGWAKTQASDAELHQPEDAEGSAVDT